VEQVALAGGAAIVDFTFWGMFVRSDLVVKTVMVLLIGSSLVCWTLIVEKGLRVRRLKALADQFEDTFWSGGSLDALYDQYGAQPPDPMSAIFGAAMREWRRTAAKGLVVTDRMRESLRERIDRVMEVTLRREVERLERYLVVLATTGSTAPFVGLFGTVWGIMNAFQGIAAAKNTNLAVVAPGLAEALFVTALGLFAAVPAVAAYNKFSSDFARYAQRLESFSAEFSAILSRQLEEKK
jgi:biopolymer transport protein TolQ